MTRLDNRAWWSMEVHFEQEEEEEEEAEDAELIELPPRGEDIIRSGRMTRLKEAYEEEGVS